MQHELAFKAITQGAVGVIFLTLLLVLLFALRKDFKRKKPLNAIVIFALAMLGLWCFVAFEKAYLSLHKMIALTYARAQMKSLRRNRNKNSK